MGTIILTINNAINFLIVRLTRLEILIITQPIVVSCRYIPFLRKNRTIVISFVLAFVVWLWSSTGMKPSSAAFRQNYSSTQTKVPLVFFFRSHALNTVSLLPSVSTPFRARICETAKVNHLVVPLLSLSRSTAQTEWHGVRPYMYETIRNAIIPSSSPSCPCPGPGCATLRWKTEKAGSAPGLPRSQFTLWGAAGSTVRPYPLRCPCPPVWETQRRDILQVPSCPLPYQGWHNCCSLAGKIYPPLPSSGKVCSTVTVGE